MDLFELLSLSKDFTITKKDDGYDVELQDEDLGAHISFIPPEIRYYVTHCYNSGIDWNEIYMDELLKLKKFCELIVKLEIAKLKKEN